MVSTRPLISMSSSSFNNPWVTVPKAQITFSKIVIFMFHSFFPSKVEVLILLFIFFQFYSVVSKINNFANSLSFSIIIIRCGLLADIRWSVCMSKPWISAGEMLGCAYTICSYGQISISCAPTSGLPCPLSRS